VGLPDLTLPRFSGLPIDLMILGSLALFLVSFGSGIVTARSFAARAGQDVDADRELVGFGMANIASGLIGGFAVTGADSRTAVNVDSGGRSQIAGLVAAAALLIMFFFFGDLLRLLPQPALGAILVVAAIGLIDVDEFHRLWYVSRVEFLFAMIAFLGPLAVGVLNGIVIAVCATLVFLLRKGMRPKIVSLGRIAGRDGFYKLHRTPDARRINGLEICLLQGNVLFFSADHVKSSLRDLTVSLPKDTRWLVLNAAGSAEFDYTGALALSQAVTDLQSRGIVIGFAELPAEAADLLKRAGVFDQVGESMVFLDLDDALRAFEATSDQTLAKVGDTHVMQTGSTKIAPSHG
jgi:sulfate permease, SulP family